MMTLLDTVPSISNIDKQSELMEEIYPVLFDSMDDILAEIDKYGIQNKKMQKVVKAKKVVDKIIK